MSVAHIGERSAHRSARKTRADPTEGPPEREFYRETEPSATVEQAYPARSESCKHYSWYFGGKNVLLLPGRTMENAIPSHCRSVPKDGVHPTAGADGLEYPQDPTY